MASQHRLESFFNELKCNEMMIFMEFMRGTISKPHCYALSEPPVDRMAFSSINDYYPHREVLRLQRNPVLVERFSLQEILRIKGLERDPEGMS